MLKYSSQRVFIHPPFQIIPSSLINSDVNKGTNGMGLKFSCVPAGMDRHSLDLLQAVKNIVGVGY